MAYRYQNDDEPGLKIERILGWTVVWIVHITALIFLMMPMQADLLTEQQNDVVSVVFIDPPPPPPPPEPPEIKKVVKEPPKKPTPPAPKPKPATPKVATQIEQPAVVVDNPRPMDTQAPPPSPPSRASVGTEDQAPSTPVKSAQKSRGTLNVLVNPKPPYPRSALLERFEGEMVLRITVGPDGVPTDVVVTKSSGNREVDRSTQRFVKQKWRFEATGVVEVGTLPIRFKLD